MEKKINSNPMSAITKDQLSMLYTVSEPTVWLPSNNTDSLKGPEDSGV